MTQTIYISHIEEDRHAASFNNQEKAAALDKIISKLPLGWFGYATQTIKSPIPPQIREGDSIKVELSHLERDQYILEEIVDLGPDEEKITNP